MADNATDSGRSGSSNASFTAYGISCMTRVEPTPGPAASSIIYAYTIEASVFPERFPWHTRCPGLQSSGSSKGQGILPFGTGMGSYEAFRSAEALMQRSSQPLL